VISLTHKPTPTASGICDLVSGMTALGQKVNWKHFFSTSAFHPKSDMTSIAGLADPDYACYSIFRPIAFTTSPYLEAAPARRL
jgi:hypothetical protein